MLLIRFIFFFNDTATTEIYTLSLHDALPIYVAMCDVSEAAMAETKRLCEVEKLPRGLRVTTHVADVAIEDHLKRFRDQLAERSEEHTSELQSRQYLVCRLLLEKKKINLLT